MGKRVLLTLFFAAALLLAGCSVLEATEVLPTPVVLGVTREVGGPTLVGPDLPEEFLVGTDSGQETVVLPVWAPPTLDQAQVIDGGGEIPEDLRGFADVIRLGFAQALIPISEQIDFRQLVLGEEYRFVFLARDPDDNLLWAKLGEGVTERFSDYPLHFNLVEFTGEDGNEYLTYVLNTQIVRYEVIPDSSGADIVWGGSDGTLPILVKNARALPDGREAFSIYWDIQTFEWKVIPGVVTAEVREGNPGIFADIGDVLSVAEVDLQGAKANLAIVKVRREAPSQIWIGEQNENMLYGVPEHAKAPRSIGESEVSVEYGVYTVRTWNGWYAASHVPISLEEGVALNVKLGESQGTFGLRLTTTTNYSASNFRGIDIFFQEDGTIQVNGLIGPYPAFQDETLPGRMNLEGETQIQVIPSEGETIFVVLDKDTQEEIGRVVLDRDLYPRGIMNVTPIVGPDSIMRLEKLEAIPAGDNLKEGQVGFEQQPMVAIEMDGQKLLLEAKLKEDGSWWLPPFTSNGRVLADPPLEDWLQIVSANGEIRLPINGGVEVEGTVDVNSFVGSLSLVPDGFDISKEGDNFIISDSENTQLLRVGAQDGRPLVLESWEKLASGVQILQNDEWTKAVGVWIRDGDVLAVANKSMLIWNSEEKNWNPSPPSFFKMLPGDLKDNLPTETSLEIGENGLPVFISEGKVLGYVKESEYAEGKWLPAEFEFVIPWERIDDLSRLRRNAFTLTDMSVGEKIQIRFDSTGIAAVKLDVDSDTGETSVTMLLSIAGKFFKLTPNYIGTMDSKNLSVIDVVGIRVALERTLDRPFSLVSLSVFSESPQAANSSDLDRQMRRYMTSEVNEEIFSQGNWYKKGVFPTMPLEYFNVIFFLGG